MWRAHHGGLPHGTRPSRGGVVRTIQNNIAFPALVRRADGGRTGSVYHVFVRIKGHLMLESSQPFKTIVEEGIGIYRRARPEEEPVKVEFGYEGGHRRRCPQAVCDGRGSQRSKP